MKTTQRIILLLVLIVQSVIAQETVHDDQLDCQRCHYCKNPAKNDPCLRECPRMESADFRQLKTDTPDQITIDILSDLYVPVVFSHKRHAKMADMSGGCRICHHHNPPGPILKCEACHSQSAKRSDLSKPALKGAYHRQCLGCHREWSHTTECAACHPLKNAQTANTGTKDTTDIVGTSHPQIPEPTKVVYETGSEEGKFVTFYHDEHINRFGFACVDCHRKEGCNKCHDLAKPKLADQMTLGEAIKIHKEESEHHKACEDCHSENTCGHCHAKTEKPRFNHLASSGWKLKNYHSTLACSSCHPNTRSIKRVNRTCSNCHQEWNSDNFNHRITGIILDENHLDNDCSGCHLENDYARSPSCSDCHDEEISYPEVIPGEEDTRYFNHSR